MCDPITEQDNQRWFADKALAEAQLGRRQFGAMGASAAVLAVVPGCVSATDAPSSGGTMTSRNVTITTADGSADAVFIHPAKSKHPAVIMWPDVAGLRDAYRAMAVRLAQSGYAVLVVNQYYRSAPAPIMATMAEWRTDAGQAKLKPMIAALNPERITGDAAAYIGWLDQQAVVNKAKKIGSCGYCMGGPYTFRTAAANPGRVGAIASFHGGGLVTEAADSPHRLIASVKAAMLIAIAQNDDEKQPTAKTELRKAADAAKRPAEIEVYPAQHGWCTIDSPVYDAVQADRAWERMLATYRQYL